MACGLEAGQLWDSRVVLSGASMHSGVLLRHFMTDWPLYMRAQLVDCFCYIQEVLVAKEAFLGLTTISRCQNVGDSDVNNPKLL
jgi:hypothetical protein